ncbi:MAG: FecR domain-containing protein [Mariprofundaceae bacterium]
MAERNDIDCRINIARSKKVGISPWFWAIAVSMVMLGSPEASYAANKVGNFTVVSGAVDALREQQDAPIAAEIGMDAFLQDVVRTKRRSRTRLKFLDDSVLNMGANHMVKVKEFVYDEDNGVRKAVLSSLRGTVRATVSKMGGDGDSLFEVESPTAIASVRGTDFIVKINSLMETIIVVLEGAVMVRNIDPDVKGQVMVRAGQKTTVAKNKAPSLPAFVPAQMQEVLIAETTPTVATGVAGGVDGVRQQSGQSSATSQSVATFSSVEVVPVAPPPPTPISFSTPQIQPIVIANQPAAAAVPPVQPPITTTVPAVITTPVVLNLIF